MWFSSTSDQPTEAMSLTMMALEREMKDPSVDTSRVYVTGLSMGAFGTWDIIRRNPNLFAAAVPMSGGGDPSTAGTIKNIPIWAFHGSDDSVVPVETTRAMIAALQAAGGNPRYTEIAGADHTIWDSVFADSDNTLYSWLFSQSLSGATNLSQGDGGFVPSSDGSLAAMAPVSSATPAVPEPTSMGLLALVGMGLLTRARRK